jgi:cytochrome c
MKIQTRVAVLFSGLVLLCAFSFTAMAQEGTAKKKAGAAKGSATDGEAIFKTNCGLCHNADKTDAKIGPGLLGLFKNKELPSSKKPVTEANVRAQMDNGAPDAKPIPMPSFKDKLTPAQKDDLIAYLKTL